MTTEWPNGSVGQEKNNTLGRNRIHLIREVEKVYYPVQKGRWVLFCLGKSVIVGPREIKTVQLSYRMENYGDIKGVDCCSKKNIRIWMKMNSSGTLSCVIHNISEHPQHITPRAKVLMMEMNQFTL